MKITLTPIVSDQRVEYRVSGESLWVNAEEHNLSGVQEGSPLWSPTLGSPWIVGHVERINGELHVSLLKPVSHDDMALEQSFSATDGWPA